MTDDEKLFLQQVGIGKLGIGHRSINNSSSPPASLAPSSPHTCFKATPNITVL